MPGSPVAIDKYPASPGDHQNDRKQANCPVIGPEAGNRFEEIRLSEYAPR